MEYLVFGTNVVSNEPGCVGIYAPGGCMCYGGTFNEFGSPLVNDTGAVNLSNFWTLGTQWQTSFIRFLCIPLMRTFQRQ